MKNLTFSEKEIDLDKMMDTLKKDDKVEEYVEDDMNDEGEVQKEISHESLTPEQKDYHEEMERNLDQNEKGELEVKRKLTDLNED